MNTGAERVLKLRSERAALEAAKQFADLAVRYCDPACREATTMAVAEFAENIIKYGVPASNNTGAAGTIGIGVEQNTLRVRVTNHVGSSADAQRVVDLVTKITASSNVMEMYRNRLRELFENPSLQPAQLGLLRIAFEGRFMLSCVFHAPELEIVAERPCVGSPPGASAA